MTDQQLAVQAMSAAQRMLEDYLEPKPHNPEHLLDRLVEVLEKPEIVSRSIDCSAKSAADQPPSRYCKKKL